MSIMDVFLSGKTGEVLYLKDYAITIEKARQNHFHYFHLIADNKHLHKRCPEEKGIQVSNGVFQTPTPKLC